MISITRIKRILTQLGTISVALMIGTVSLGCTKAVEPEETKETAPIVVAEAAEAATPTVEATATPSPTPTIEPTNTPSPTLTPEPTAEPTPRLSIKKTQCGHYLIDKDTEDLLSNGDIGSVGYFFWSEAYQQTIYYLIVKNNTSSAVAVQAKTVAQTQSGESIPGFAPSLSVFCLEPGDISYMSDLFGANDVVSVNSSLTTYEPSAYPPDYLPGRCSPPCLKDLKMELYENRGLRETSILLTNTGTEYIHYPQVAVFFFDSENNLLGVDESFAQIADINGELKPGNTYAGSFAPQTRDAYNYDHLCVCVNAYVDTWRERFFHPVIIENDQIEMHTYEQSDLAGTIFLSVRNNSPKMMCATVCQIIKDDSGNVLKADPRQIQVLAPGQETILGFDNIYKAQNIIQAESEFYIEAEEYSKETGHICMLDDVSPYLKIEESIDGRDVTVTVTNRYKLSIDYIYITVLFFNQNDELIDYKQESFYYQEPPNGGWGLEQGFPSGKTVSKVLTSDTDFSYIKLFVSHNETLAEEIRRLNGWNY